MTVVSNAGPIIALSQIGRLDFLHLQDDTVFIPPAVYTELIRCKAKVDATPWGFYMSKELHRAVLALADEQIS